MDTAARIQPQAVPVPGNAVSRVLRPVLSRRQLDRVHLQRIRTRGSLHSSGFRWGCKAADFQCRRLTAPLAPRWERTVLSRGRKLDGGTHSYGNRSNRIRFATCAVLVFSYRTDILLVRCSAKRKSFPRAAPGGGQRCRRSHCPLWLVT